MTGSVAIIGAGMAGLAAAHALAAAGASVTVFEKSRGIGGRLATRRTREGLDFDHGAPAVSGGNAVFSAFLRATHAAGHCAPWQGEITGVPGMSALSQTLAQGIDIRFGTPVDTVTPLPGGWRVNGDTWPALICTAPAPQTARICEAIPAIARAAASARMIPCWTLMAAWNSAPPSLVGTAEPLASAARVSAKPGRAATPERWVAHATTAWSIANLERDKEDVSVELLAALSTALALDPAAAVYAAAHRWRHARVVQAVGLPCVAVGGIVAAGDWLLGPDAADAHASGLAAAAAILKR